jgi:hypothetical protein
LETKEENEMNEKCHSLLSGVFMNLSAIIIKAMKKLINTTNNNGECTKVLI